MPAMDYSQVAELYDFYVQTEVDVPFFLQEAQGCRNVLELTLRFPKAASPEENTTG